MGYNATDRRNPDKHLTHDDAHDYDPSCARFLSRLLERTHTFPTNLHTAASPRSRDVCGSTSCCPTSLLSSNLDNRVGVGHIKYSYHHTSPFARSSKITARIGSFNIVTILHDSGWVGYGSGNTGLTELYCSQEPNGARVSPMFPHRFMEKRDRGGR